MKKQTQNDCKPSTETKTEADPRINGRNLAAALDHAGYASKGRNVTAVKEYCIHHAVSAVLTKHIQPVCDLGQSALRDLAWNQESEKAMATALAAIEPHAAKAFADIRAILQKYHSQALPGIARALAPFQNSENEHAKETAVKALKTAGAILDERCQAAPRRITGSEFFDIIRGARTFVDPIKVGPGESDRIQRPASSPSEDGKHKVSGLRPAISRLSRLLRRLDIYSRANLALVEDWAIDFGFRHFRRIHEHGAPQEIVLGNYVHARAVSTKQRKLDSNAVGDNAGRSKPANPSAAAATSPPEQTEHSGAKEAPPAAPKTEAKIKPGNQS